MLDQIIPAVTFLGLSFGQLTPITLAQKQFSLSNRQSSPYVNEIFKKNILLNLNYMGNKVKPGDKFDWSEIDKPFETSFILGPNQTFAFHDDVLPQYHGKVSKTTNAHFNAQEGFLTDGYLYGDGVCHLASFINLAARDANLDVKAPTRHDFAVIPDVSREYGVSIYNNPYAKGSNARQNLYITNNYPKPVEFRFEYKNDTLNVKVINW